MISIAYLPNPDIVSVLYHSLSIHASKRHMLTMRPAAATYTGRDSAKDPRGWCVGYDRLSWKPSFRFPTVPGILDLDPLVSSFRHPLHDEPIRTLRLQTSVARITDR